ncbi:NPC intracellular cholesterol transporter 2 [Helicoverpa armigera]|uniref:NPC intracellular cholesterol transporter 2 n=1 Tax=Helicoverpa armigera TaxID=29058 RepID=UPI000B3805DE|nr:NPC intracellular cholesterol transporter 2 [Helicoverpa armigera]XP_047033582.1 NPC intracellular cholesterol transporter 2-like [Helicoverpa zea]PZC80876.1 hypothetical protein B5X24_HaOG213863 [Helicoverpa armigera]
MVALRVVVCFAVLAASAVATNVRQCPGKSIENLSDNVQLSPCQKPPCKLKKGTDQSITINFTPETDIKDVVNKVSADVAGINLPFVGVDGNSICDKIFTESGEKASCPVKAGTKYTYKDSFPVYAFYPSLKVKVHWALSNADTKSDFMCFEVPAQIA